MCCTRESEVQGWTIERDMGLGSANCDVVEEFIENVKLYLLLCI